MQLLFSPAFAFVRLIVWVFSAALGFHCGATHGLPNICADCAGATIDVPGTRETSLALACISFPLNASAKGSMSLPELLVMHGADINWLCEELLGHLTCFLVFSYRKNFVPCPFVVMCFARYA